MTIAIQTGPPWISLDSQGNLTGTAPTVGTYSVILQSTVGAETATLAVSVIASALGLVSSVQTSLQSELGQIVLSFTASLVARVLSSLWLTLNFTADVGASILYIAPDSFEPNGSVDDLLNFLPEGGVTYDSITNGQELVCTMPAGDTQDWFSFVTSSDGPITCTLTALTRPPDVPATSLGLDISLFSTSSSIFSIWDASVTMTAPTVTSPSQLAARYNIRVSNPAGRIAQYKLTITW